MNIKFYSLHAYFSYFLKYLENLSEDQGKIFHQKEYEY